MTNDTEIGVYTDLLQPGADCIRVGTLWIHHRRQGSASFEYSQEWLNHPHSYELEPMLPLGRGKYHTAPEQVLFGSMSDSAPDRWGRRLIQQAHRKDLPGYPTVSGALGEQHYLLGVNDVARMGALRYSTDGGSTFLHTEEGASIPPIIDLLPLHHAAEHLCRDTATPAELRMLLNPGSSLGGAWPKAPPPPRSRSYPRLAFFHSLRGLKFRGRSVLRLPEKPIYQSISLPVMLNIQLEINYSNAHIGNKESQVGRTRVVERNVERIEKLTKTHIAHFAFDNRDQI